MSESPSDTLSRLYGVVLERRAGDQERSYVAKLTAKGMPKIAQKVGEEAVEVAIAATSQTKQEVIAESADLLFHLLILWAASQVTPEEVMEEIRRREGISGLEEKALRRLNAKGD